MTKFAQLRGKAVFFQFARTAFAGLLIAVEAGSSRSERSIESIATRTADEPVLAFPLSRCAKTGIVWGPRRSTPGHLEAESFVLAAGLRAAATSLGPLFLKEGA